jgi:hypothetical protein
MSYILNMLICVSMILLDNLLQYLLCIAMIYLSRTYGSTAILICNALVVFMIYFWIKIKLKLLIFPSCLPMSLSFSTKSGTWVEDLMCALSCCFVSLMSSTAYPSSVTRLVAFDEAHLGPDAGPSSPPYWV